MKALTLTPEWAWAVCHLDKRVENRTWRPPEALIGQRIAIHAGKAKPDWTAVELMARCAGWSITGHPWRDFSKDGATVNRPDAHRLPVGVIVATALLRGVREVSQAGAVGWEAGPFCWDLDDVRLLTRPIAYKGALGLWPVPGDLS